MSEPNIEAATVIMRYLVAVYPRLFQSTKDTLTAWAQTLDADMPVVDAENAIKEVIASSEAIPTVAAVNNRWRAVKARRLDAVGIWQPDPPREISLDPAAYKTWLTTYRREVAAGTGSTLAATLANKQASQVLAIGSAKKPPQIGHKTAHRRC